MSYIIAVSNEKGGVGKTSSALSLGAALVETGKEVLLIDIDPQANLTLALDIDPDKTRQSAARILLESASPASVSRETAIPGLDIIPANSELGLVERFLPLRHHYELVLRQALTNNAALYYSYIIIDCPPFLGANTLNALTASNLVIIPTQAEFFSMRALRNMIGLVKRVREQGNPDLAYRFLITMFDKRNRIHRELSEQLHQKFSRNIFNTIVETDTKLRECPVMGLPIIYYAPKSRSAQRYRELALEINQYVKEADQQPA